MTSRLHEVLLEMFRARPALAAELLASLLGVAVPAHHEARLEAADLTDLAPTEYRADAVVVLTEGDRSVMAVVVEIQLGRDGDKRWSWPVYVATLRARLRCPVELLVVCSSASIARWSAEPIALGVSGSQVTPLVLGPKAVPVVTDLGLARGSPELTVLSALAHGREPAGRAVLDALLAALECVDGQQGLLYLELVHTLMPDAAKRHLEGLVSTHTDETKSEFMQFLDSLAAKRAAEAEALGEARGEAKAVITVLEARGVPVSEADRDRIVGCIDPVQLDSWVRRAVTVETADGLFS